MSTINGQEYQHSLIKLNVLAGAPIRLKTFSKLAFSCTGEKKAVQDSQGQVIGWTIDAEKFDGSISLLRSEWLTLKTTLLTQNPGLGILQVRNDWDITYGNSFVTFQTARLTGVMFNKDTFDSENNQEALNVEIPLFIMGSTDENGLPPIVYFNS
jgi:hypothetical protein